MRAQLIAKTLVVALLLAAGCDSPLELTGALRVSVATSGGDLDLDGYAVRVDGVDRQTIAVDGEAVIADLATGSHQVALGDVAPNCTPAGPTPAAVVVRGGATIDVDFIVACVATGVRITTTTTGPDVDTDGYAAGVDGVLAGILGANGSVEITRLAAGTHTVGLTAVDANCAVTGENPRSVAVPAGQVVAVAFAATCVATSGVIEIRAATTGLDLDANGYTFQVDGGASQALPTNGVARVPGLGAGDHSVTLTGAAGNCAVGGDNPRTLPLTIGGATRDTARTTFEIACTAVTGIIEVAAATDGVERDPDGYTIQVDGGSPRAITINGLVRFEGLAGGDHSVTLAGAASNCAIDGDNPRTVPVTTGGATRDTARTTFAVTCLSTVGTIRVQAVTSGSEPDPDGYGVFVDESCYNYYGYQYCYYSWTGSVPANGVVTTASLVVGSHTVMLTGVARNCALAGNNPRTVTVLPGDATTETFTVTCARTGAVQVTVTTTGVDIDPNGYSIIVDGLVVDTSATVAANGTVVVANLVAGEYTVTFGGQSANCSLTSPNPRTASVPSGGTGAIAFDVDCVTAPLLAATVNSDIYTFKLNGADLTKLTAYAGWEDAPTWSPDGSQIAFRSNGDGNAEIYKMNAAGTGQTRLTTAPAADYAPAWSPDGTKIAFVSERDGNAEIYVMNTDGTGVARLTNHLAGDAGPAWSPDGSRIAFTSTREIPNGAIHVMNANGTGAVRLTDGGFGGDGGAAWSPNGAKIAFNRVVACEYYYCERDLFVMNADGSIVTQLTSGPDDHGDPDWSPDGGWIAFNAAPCQYYEGCYDWRVKVVRSNGMDVRDVIGGPAFHPAWRP